MNSILGQIVPKVKPTHQKALIDFDFFCGAYLGHYFSSPPAPYQNELMAIINSRSISSQNAECLKPFIKDSYHNAIRLGSIKALISAEPREHGKSTRLSMAYPLWRLVTGQSHCIVIICANKILAEGALSSIRTELEENEELLADFGDVTRGAGLKADSLILNNGCAIFAKGAKGAMRGLKYREKRPDLIICDDILKDEYANTMAQRDKLYNWFFRAVVPMGREAFFVIVNTIFHDDDLISRLFKRMLKGELPGWAALRFGTITPLGQSLWPSAWPLEKLEAKRLEIGSHAFTTEYMNEPINDNDRLFKSGWFNYFNPSMLMSGLAKMTVYMGVDSSVGKKSTADRFAIVTVAIDKSGLIYVIDEWAQAVSADRAVKKLIEKYQAFKPKKILFEDYGFQHIYKQHIVKQAAAYKVYLPIVGANTGRVGKERILKLSPLIENGLLSFKAGSEVVGQLLDYPKSTHDDLQDALFYAVNEATTTSSPKPFFNSSGSSLIDFLNNY